MTRDSKLCGCDRFDRQLLQMRCVEGGMMPLEDCAFFSCRRIADANFEQETVELRFRERVSSFEFERVLRSENSEISVEGMSLAIHRHLTLFHAFEQGSLRARRHAVDFVRKQELREHGPAMKAEFVRF